MNPQVEQTGLDFYYTDYIGRKRLGETKKMAQRQVQYDLDASVIEKFIPPTTRASVLDIGCNGGFFLGRLSDKFFRYGTELDRQAVSFARKQFPEFGPNIHHGNLHSANYPKHRFDLVVMRGVIEHLLDPVGHISEVSRILKPNGFFLICATPNGASFCADLYREQWRLFHPIQHLWHFSQSNLSSICERHGLQNIWHDFPYIDTPYASPERDLEDICRFINQKDLSISPPFFGNMMSLVYKKDFLR